MFIIESSHLFDIHTHSVNNINYVVYLILGERRFVHLFKQHYQLLPRQNNDLVHRMECRNCCFTKHTKIILRYALQNVTILYEKIKYNPF